MTFVDDDYDDDDDDDDFKKQNWDHVGYSRWRPMYHAPILWPPSSVPHLQLALRPMVFRISLLDYWTAKT